MRKNHLVLPLLALSLVVLSCGEDDGPPVARVDVTPRQVRLGFPEMQTLQLTWTPTAELEGLSSQPMVFIHLRDDKNKLVRTFDHPFPQKWRTGAPVTDEAQLFQSQLSPPLSPGKYTVPVGLYEGKRRWALEGLGERVDRAEYVAAQVEVPSESTAPKLVFSPQWQPVEPGGDRQVLVRGCGGFEMSVSGPGSHEIEVPVETTPNGACRIGLNPNYSIVTVNTGKRRSVSLENAAWKPGPRKAEAPPPAAPQAPAAPAAPAPQS